MADANTVPKELYDEAYFEHFNRGFDQFQKGEIHPSIERAYLLERPQGKRIVDLGCGRGELVIRAVQDGNQATGVDFSRAALIAAEALAQQVLSEKEVSRVCYKEMDVKTLTLEQDSADVVFALDVVEHLYPPELDQMMQGVKRILSAGGSFVVHTSPNVYLTIIPRFIYHAFGRQLKSETFHVNEQSTKSLLAVLNRHFPNARLDVYYDFDPTFWSGSFSGGLVQRCFRCIDFVLYHPWMVRMYRWTRLDRWLWTDIYVRVQV